MAAYARGSDGFLCIKTESVDKLCNFHVDFLEKTIVAFAENTTAYQWQDIEEKNTTAYQWQDKNTTAHQWQDKIQSMQS